MYFPKSLVQALFIFLITFFRNVLSTEISISSTVIYEYLGVRIELPVFLCHVRHTGYKEVIWKKDSTIVKNGSSDLPSHVLSLKDLLDVSSSELENPFKLQGYYWCETDVSSLAYVHDYLFQIKNIYTYIGKLVAKNDSLRDDDNTSFVEKLYEKKVMYEGNMQGILFRALPHTSISVKDIKVFKEGGLEVHFYLYVREPFDPRKRTDNNLVMDEENLLDIKHYLKNETLSADVNDSLSYNEWLNWIDWIDLLGINLDDIDVKSTLGCYKEASSNTTRKITWPYARIGEVVIPDNACLSKNGLAVTRMCTGSFDLGATWGSPSGRCGAPANEITMQLKDIYDNYGKIANAAKIETLIELTGYSSKLGVADLHIVAKILAQLSTTPNLNQQEISGIFSIIDNVMDTNKTELVAAKNIIRLTSRFLRIFDNILKQTQEEGKEIRISKRHLMVDTKYTEGINAENLVLGLAVIAPNFEDSLSSGSVDFLYSSEKLPKLNSIAHFSLPRELVLQRLSQSDIPCQVNMVFFKKWHLFQNPQGVLVKRNYRVLPTPVMYISISGGPAWNLTDPVQLYFKDTFQKKIEDPVCVYYDSWLDDGAGAWNSEGCEYKGMKNGYYHCQCHHLSIYAIILSEAPYSFHQDFKLGTSVYVGCGASIIALSLSVVVYLLSKNWRKTVDHKILFCLSLTFLACVILIYISELHFKRGPGCIVLAMIFHYTIFATFGWLMVQAVIYRLRFAKKTDVSEIPHFMTKAALSVWVAPIIIIMIIWFTKDFSYPVTDGCWLTVYEVAKFSTIPVVIMISITLCINLCATYSLTCRYKEDFLIGDTGYNDVAMKFRVAFTIFSFFVLSWLFGFLALHKRSPTLRILFSISLTLTAYYVTLFFIFQEVSFWDLCKCCRRKEDQNTPVVEYNVKPYKSAGETNVTEK